MHGLGPMLVTAGPGSGKTTVITYRIYYLIHSMGISPENILVITFTKAAAKQMQERYYNLAESEEKGVTFSTFHAFFYHLIQCEHAFDSINVLREQEKRSVMFEILKQHGVAYPQSEMIEEILRQISYMRNQFSDFSLYQPLYFEHSFYFDVYRTYSEYVKNLGKVDFDDMMLECFSVLKSKPEVLERWQNKFHFFMIDEFQDINPLQYEILMLLAQKNKNLFCVGDEDQAIYGFRGASPKLMFSFLKEFDDVKHILMTRNYRSEEAVVSCANRIIEKNTNRFDKKVIAVSKNGADSVFVKKFDSINEQYFEMGKQLLQFFLRNDIDDAAILFRTNYIPQEFLDVMCEMKIPLRLKTSFLTLADEEVTKDIYAYLMLAHGKLSAGFLRRIMNKPVRYLSKELICNDSFTWEELFFKAKGKQYVIDALHQIQIQLNFIKELPLYAAVQFIRKGIGYESYAVDKAGEKRMRILSLLDEIQNNIKKYDTPQEWMTHLMRLKDNEQKNVSTGNSGVSVLTMHAAKGLEWDFVLIPDVNDGMYPFHRAKTKEELEEERRIFYVGMTRAKNKLFISGVNNAAMELKPSVYFKDLMI